MPRQIAIIDGHPDPERAHFGHALAEAYAQGARENGHIVETILLGETDVPLLRSQKEWETGRIPASLRDAQETIGWADHLVIIYPLWLGDVPAILKAFLEQVLRPGFAFTGSGGMAARHLKGKSARIVVTMGMPAFVYRWYFGAHSLKSLKRSVLGFVGIRPVKATLIGGIGAMQEAKRTRWLENLRSHGRKGD